jgi:hypothetical protein
VGGGRGKTPHEKIEGNNFDAAAAA